METNILRFEDEEQQAFQALSRIDAYKNNRSFIQHNLPSDVKAADKIATDSYEKTQFLEDDKVVKNYSQRIKQLGLRAFESLRRTEQTEKQKQQADYLNSLAGITEPDVPTAAEFARFEAAAQNIPEVLREDWKATQNMRYWFTNVLKLDPKSIDASPVDVISAYGKQLGLTDTSPKSVWNHTVDIIKKDHELNIKLEEFDEKSIEAGLKGSGWWEINQEGKKVFGEQWKDLQGVLRANFLVAKKNSRSVKEKADIIEAGMNEYLFGIEQNFIVPERKQIDTENWENLTREEKNSRLGKTLKADKAKIGNASALMGSLSDDERYFILKELRNRGHDQNYFDRMSTAFKRGVSFITEEGWAKAGRGTQSAVLELFPEVSNEKKTSGKIKERLGQEENLKRFAEYEYKPYRNERYGRFLNGVLDFGNMIPFTVGAVVSPYAVYPSLAGHNFADAAAMSQEGNSAGQFAASSVAALGEAYLESAVARFGLRFIKGGGAMFGTDRLSSQIMNGVRRIKNPVARAGIGFASGAAASQTGEFVTEKVQDVTNPLAQWLAAGLGGYESGVDWGRFGQDFFDKEGNLDLFFALLPMSLLVGAGGATNSVAAAQYMSENHRIAKDRFGFTQAQIDTIEKEPDAEKRTQLWQATGRENLKKLYPVEPGRVSNAESIVNLSRETGVDASRIEADTLAYAKENGVNAEDVLVYRDETTEQGYSFDVLPEMRQENTVNDADPFSDGLTEEERNRQIHEGFNRAYVERMRQRAADLEAMGYPLLQVSENEDTSTPFYYESPLTGERMAFETRGEALNALSVEYAQIDDVLTDEAKKELNEDIGAALDEAAPEGALNRFEFRQDEFMSLEKVAQRSEAAARAAETRLRIAQSQGEIAAGRSLRQIQVMGENESRLVRGVNLVGTQKIYAGASPLDVFEERAEALFDFYVHNAYFTLDEAERWLRQAEASTGESFLNLNADGSNREMALKEGWSSAARAWVVGNIRDERLPAKLLRWFRAMLLTFTDAMRFAKDLLRARALMDARDRQDLDSHFMKYLSDSVGMNWEENEARLEQKMRDDLQAEVAGGMEEIADSLKGKLLHWETARAHNDPLWGELKAVYDAMTRIVDVQPTAKRRDGGTRKRHKRLQVTKAAQYFLPKGQYVGIDQVRDELNQHGYDYETPAEMLDDLRDSVDYGIHHYPVTSRGNAEEERLRSLGRSFSVGEMDAEQKKVLFGKSGVMDAENGLLAEPSPDLSFAIEAGHVSRADFREFDTDFMGTGEGAQAYGWGFYFWTNRQVRDFYRKSFNNAANEFVFDAYDTRQGGRISAVLHEDFQQYFDIDISEIARESGNSREFDKAIKDRLTNEREYTEEQIAGMQSYIDGLESKSETERSEETNEALQESRQKLQAMLDSLDMYERYLGYSYTYERLLGNSELANTYKVRLKGEPSDFLNWNGMPENIDFDSMMAGLEGMDVTEDRLRSLTGEELYKDLAVLLGSAQEASEFLSTQGVKGIRYNDASGEGTYNYVVFDPENIEITHVMDSESHWQKYRPLNDSHDSVWSASIEEGNGGGQPSRLTPEQGRQESLAIKEFMEGDPVASSEGSNFPNNGEDLIDRVQAWILENYGEYVTSPILGNVRISKRDIKDSWREGRRDDRAEAFVFAPAIIEKGIMIGSQENYKGKKGLNRMLVAAPVELRGEKMYGVVSIQYDANIKRMVFHDVYTIERTMNVQNKKAQHAGTHGTASLEEGQRSVAAVEPVLNVLRRHLFVKPDITFSLEGMTELLEDKDPVSVRKLLFDYVSKGSAETAKIFGTALDRFNKELKKQFFSRDGVNMATKDAGADMEQIRVMKVVRVMDALLSALPGEVRGKVYDAPHLRDQAIQARTDKGRNNAFVRLVIRMQDVLERNIVEEQLKSIERVMKYATPALGNNNIKTGKLTPEIQQRISRIEQIMGLSERDLDHKIQSANQMIEDEEASDSEWNAAAEEVLLLETFGGIYQKTHSGRYLFDSRKMGKAFEVLERIYTQGRAMRKAKNEERKEYLDNKKGEVIAALGATKGVHANDLSKSSTSSKGGFFTRLLQNIVSFPQFMQMILGRNNTVAIEFEDRKYAATERYNTISQDRTENAMSRFKDVLGVKTDYDVAMQFSEWHERREWDIDVPSGIVEEVITLTHDEAKQVIQDMDLVAQERKPASELPEWARNIRARLALEGAYLDWTLRRTENIAFSFSYDKGETKKLELSEFEVADVLNFARQTEYENSLSLNGYTPEVIEKMKEQIDSRVVEINEFFAEEYDRGYDESNEVYRRIFHMDMPRTNHYSPGEFYTSGQEGKGNDLRQGGGQSIIGIGAIKTRRKHSAVPKIRSAWERYYQHFQMMDYWRTHAELLRDINAIMLNAEVKKAVDGKWGSYANKHMQEWLQAISCYGAINAANFLGVNQLARRLASGIAEGALSFNVNTMIKQFPATTASFMEMDSPAEAFKSLAYSFQYGERKEIAGSTLMQQRFELGVSPELRAFNDYSYMKPSRLSDFNRHGMSWIGAADNYFTSLSGNMAYAYHYKQALDSGLAPEKAKQVAMATAERVIRRTAQPNETEMRSMSEIYAGGFISSLYMFRSEMRKNAATALLAAWQWRQGELTAGTAAWKAFSGWVLPGLLSPFVLLRALWGVGKYITGGGDPEDAEALMKWMRSGMLEMSSGLWMAGDAMEGFYDFLMKKLFEHKSFSYDNSNINKLWRAIEAIQNIGEYFSDDGNEKDFIKQLNTASQGINIALSLTGKVKGLGAGMQIGGRMAKQMDGVYEFAKSNFTEEGRLEKQVKTAARLISDETKAQSKEEKKRKNEGKKLYASNPEMARYILQSKGWNGKEIREAEAAAMKASLPGRIKSIARLPIAKRREVLKLLPDTERKQVEIEMRKARLKY